MYGCKCKAWFRIIYDAGACAASRASLREPQGFCDVSNKSLHTHTLTLHTHTLTLHTHTHSLFTHTHSLVSHTHTHSSHTHPHYSHIHSPACGVVKLVKAPIATPPPFSTTTRYMYVVNGRTSMSAITNGSADNVPTNEMLALERVVRSIRYSVMMPLGLVGVVQVMRTRPLRKVMDNSDSPSATVSVHVRTKRDMKFERP